MAKTAPRPKRMAVARIAWLPGSSSEVRAATRIPRIGVQWKLRPNQKLASDRCLTIPSDSRGCIEAAAVANLGAG